MGKNFIIFKTSTNQSQKTRAVGIEKTRKMHENFRNYASSRYWLSVHDPCRDAFEAGGSRCNNVN